MAETLQININLEHLNLANCGLVRSHPLHTVATHEFLLQEMNSLVALLTVLRYNPSLKTVDLSRPVPQYQHTNWVDDIAIHIAQMLEVSLAARRCRRSAVFSVEKYRPARTAHSKVRNS